MTNLGLYNDRMNKITSIDNESPITYVTFLRDDNALISIGNFAHAGYYEFTNHDKNVDYTFTTSQIVPFLENNPHIAAALEIGFCEGTEDSCPACKQIAALI